MLEQAHKGSIGRISGFLAGPQAGVEDKREEGLHILQRLFKRHVRKHFDYL